MGSPPKLATLRIYVLMDDGAEFTVQTKNPDNIRWELMRHAKKWPQLHEAPLLAMPVLAWAALTREKLIPQMTWDEFAQRCEQCGDAGSETVDPTSGDLEAG